MISRGLAILALLGLAHCGAEEPCACGPDGGPCGDDAGAPEDVPPGSLLVPYIAGSFEMVYRPSGGRYLNDHTLVPADGQWHVYGITNREDPACDPFLEHHFLHATARVLDGPWVEQEDAVRNEVDERFIWAPYVFAREPGRWSMVYWGEPLAGDGDRRGLRWRDSMDLFHWPRNEAVRVPGGRDPMVLRAGGRWLVYSVGVDGSAHGQIVVSESTDLVTWSAPEPVITDPVASYGWGNLESPFVVERAGHYYLFLTRTGPSSIDYMRTMIFRSQDPRHFRWSPRTELQAHAAEVIETRAGWFITSAGKKCPDDDVGVGEVHRGLSIAPLGWAAE